MPGPSGGAPEPDAKRPRSPGPKLRVASWNVDVSAPGKHMARIAYDVAKMLTHVDVVLLQELGAWDKPLNNAGWDVFLKEVLGKKADEWAARRNGPYGADESRLHGRGR